MRPDSIAAGIRRSEAQHLEGLAELSFVGLKPLTSFRDEVPRRASSPPSPRCEQAPQRSVRSRVWLPTKTLSVQRSSVSRLVSAEPRLSRYGFRFTSVRFGAVRAFGVAGGSFQCRHLIISTGATAEACGLSGSYHEVNMIRVFARLALATTRTRAVRDGPLQFGNDLGAEMLRKKHAKSN